MWKAPLDGPENLLFWCLLLSYTLPFIFYYFLSPTMMANFFNA
ncbi:hypothetical protein C427_1625 [Paraglaciecola psychrophila 170]|uniref:Uncharacterized protein n=1 Tax=Paraglaciecola psychrophila 170 TaxID=1129794 RepID=K7AKF6_9ALTE|nr:hypothetical protein C427_1625 [Paraglaciecola psychrophila 170]GAC35945.1 hypothetical protein GPSY_0303 [Paraglaciecola psychrophila 170]